MESNDFSIKSLKFKMVKDFESADAFHQQAIDAREDAKKAGDECEKLLDKSKELENAYYRIVEYFEGKKI
jgi:Asp-tRNA(Asn)/Glu-tRNA(Gln) amidotransferase C subunit